MKKFALLLFFTALMLVPSKKANSSINFEEKSYNIENSIVKIIVTSQRPDFYSPWKMRNITTASGSGFIIKGNRIMTNAHVVANAKYILVLKANDPDVYTASIEHIGHDCDLAILKINNKKFFNGTHPLEFAKLPKLNDTVYAYGYPVGGNRVSVTKGIVSRIDYILYTHSGIDYHLAVQIDAAINPGNSGGPIIKDGKVVGVAFQSLMWAENSGYMIPYPVIDRFLRDISDGKYDGYIELGFFYQELENKAIRKYFNMPENLSGILVTKIFMKNTAKVLKLNDIILQIDDYKIANNGTIKIWGERLPFTEAAETKLPGEKVKLKIFRKGKILEKELVVEKFDFPIELANSYNEKPEYLIVGGFVFVPLSREFLKTWGAKWYDEASKFLLYHFFYYITDDIYKTKPSLIILSRRLPDPVNTYCENYEDLAVKKVNGQNVYTLKDMKEAIYNARGEYLVIEFYVDVPPIVVKIKDLEKANKRIMKLYNIRALEHIKEEKINE